MDIILKLDLAVKFTLGLSSLRSALFMFSIAEIWLLSVGFALFLRASLYVLHMAQLVSRGAGRPWTLNSFEAHSDDVLAIKCAPRGGTLDSASALPHNIWLPGADCFEVPRNGSKPIGCDREASKAVRNVDYLCSLL